MTSRTPCDHLYDTAAPNVWGLNATSLVRDLCASTPVEDMAVLDAGCGEGRNAAYLAARGARVHAVDLSDLAIARALTQWGGVPGVRWQQADLARLPLLEQGYDVAVLYSVTHWLASPEQVRLMTGRIKRAVKTGGLVLFCGFNARLPYPHRIGTPTMLTHEENLGLFADWEVVTATDSDLVDAHADEPEHVHAMSRIVARREG
jgi:SAM-dependent methyltransferase